MPKHEAARTLVKSPPELWEACSDPTSLSRHLEPFGEIRITRLEPETTVAWEGERASGTVRIEPSGWGTRVTLTAAAGGPETPAPAQSPRPPEAVRRPPGLFTRLLRLWSPPPPTARPAPAPPAPGPSRSLPALDAVAALDAALDSLGAAHRRPFSRG
jgi:hypothetical protein